MLKTLQDYKQCFLKKSSNLYLPFKMLEMQFILLCKKIPIQNFMKYLLCLEEQNTLFILNKEKDIRRDEMGQEHQST